MGQSVAGSFSLLQWKFKLKGDFFNISVFECAVCALKALNQTAVKNQQEGDVL